jgi:hypothetical protein
MALRPKQPEICEQLRGGFLTPLPEADGGAQERGGLCAAKPG